MGEAEERYGLVVCGLKVKPLSLVCLDSRQKWKWGLPYSLIVWIDN